MVLAEHASVPASVGADGCVGGERRGMVVGGVDSRWQPSPASCSPPFSSAAARVIGSLPDPWQPRRAGGRGGGGRGRVRRARAADGWREPAAPPCSRPSRSATWAGVSIVWSIAGDRSWDCAREGLVTAFAVVGVACGIGLRRAAVRAAAVAGRGAGRRARLGASRGSPSRRSSRRATGWRGCASRSDTGTRSPCWPTPRLRSGSGSHLRRDARGVLAELLVYAAVLALLLTQSRAGVVAGVLVSVLARTCLVPPRGWAPPRARGGAGVRRRRMGVHQAGAGRGWRAARRPRLRRCGVRAAGRRRWADGGRARAPRPAHGSRASTVAPDARPRRRRAGRSCSPAAGSLAASVGNPVAWAGDQVSRGECVNDPSRLTELCANNRLAWWGEAVDVWRADPLGERRANLRDRPQALAGRWRDVSSRTACRCSCSPTRAWSASGSGGARRAVGRRGRPRARDACDERSGMLPLRSLPAADLGGPRPRRLRPGLPRRDGAGARRLR